MVKRKNKIVYIILLIIYLLNACSGLVNAAQLTTNPQLVDLGDCGNHLEFWDTKQDAWSYVITTYIGYTYQGHTYPAYCMDSEKPGVGESGSYTVDISKLLDRVDVWRTITAGFPYRTAQQLGCSTDEDAFVATKQAVYCILDGSNPRTKYNGADARGTAIKNAIINLVDEGRNGSRTPQTANVTINKIGGLKQEGNNYTQEFSVSSFVNMGQYTITATTGLPDGTKIVNMDNVDQTTFNSDGHFKVVIPKDKIKDNIEATILVKTSCETYPIFYGKAPNGGLQDYAITFDPMSDEQATVTLSINAHQSTIKVIKEDSKFKYRIAGVTFNFRYKDGENIGNYTTDNNGEITVTGLKAGTIIAKEISTNEDYILDSTEKEIKLGYAETKTLTVENDRQTGSLQVYKVDKDNKKIGIGNVEFDLYSHEEKKVIGTYYTDADGYIRIDNLRVGTYSLIEKKTNKWYKLSSSKEVKVEWKNITNVTVENELKKGQVKVIKVDKDNKEIKLANVKFDVLDKNGKVLETIVTNGNGEALTSKYPLRDFDSLTLREKETLETYSLDTTPQTVVLEEDQIKTLIFTNEVKKGQIKVIKVDADNKEYKIPDVEFKVYDESGKVVDTLITDKNGEATSKKLPISQDYKVQETKTGKWYVLNNEPQTVTLKENEITNLTFTNEKKKGQIRVIKVDKNNHEVLLKGVTFDVLDEDKNVVDTVVTNEKGEATTKKLPIDKSYTIVEKATRKEYVLTKETQTVTLKENEIKNIVFENEKIKGKLSILKVDETDKNKTLKGAKFGIYDENDKLVQTIETNEDGIATSDWLYIGKYYAKELDTGSVYYLLNENTYEFEIKNDGETVEKTIDNTPVDITVDVDKKGTSEIKANDKVNYEFSNVANNSNVYLENFKWFDYIPTDYIRLEKMTTGTWNQDLTYSVYYKTNKSEDYILFKENLSTRENYDLDFTAIELAEDEYITETMYDFGKVDTGFKETTSPTMQCQSLDTLQDGETFTNHTKTIGTYYGVTAESDSDWTTVVHVPEETHEEELPKTGK